MTAAAQPLVEARGLSHSFDDVAAVDGLDLQVFPGEIFGLVGPDGAGKTTTLRMFCGLLEPSQGELRVAGFELPRQASLVKDSTGYMAQRLGLYLDLTVDENMGFYGDLFGLPSGRRETLARELLAMTRMEPFRGRQAGKLSGGMKQKLALMCALLHEPQVLLLDEPTNGVDPISRRDFWIILYRLVRAGLTVVISTSYLDEAERCHRIGLIYKGRLVTVDSPEHLSQSLEEQCYEVRCSDQRAARQVLLRQRGVLTAEPSGPVLHLFLRPLETSPGQLVAALDREHLGGAVFGRIRPSVEDVFIALVRKQELAGS